MLLAWRACAFFLLLAVAACGGDDGGKGGTPDAPIADPDEGLRSGSRIHLAWHEYGDTKVYAGLFDTQRNEACTPTVWTDGNSYCTPATSPVVYTDASCMQPLGKVLHFAGCTAITPAYFLANDIVGCTTVPSHLYQAGAQTAAVPYYLRDAFSGACVGPTTSSANFDYYTIGAEVAPTGLAQLTKKPATPADTGRIQRQFMTTTDGAAVFAPPHDSMLNLDCKLVPLQNATALDCAPASQLSNYFHDSLCKMPTLVTRAECAKPAYASLATKPRCPNSTVDYYTTGDQTTSQPLYTSSCTSTTEIPQSAYYLLSQALSVTTMTRTVDTTAGRTVQLIHDANGTASVRDGLLFDTGHTTECVELTQLDGSTRCMPLGGNIASFFSDGTCATAVQVVQIAVGDVADSCPPTVVPKYVSKTLPPMPPDVCGSTYEVYEVGAQYTGTLFTGTPSACTQADTTGFQNYALGPQHALTEFPQATATKD